MQKRQIQCRCCIELEGPHATPISRFPLRLGPSRPDGQQSIWLVLRIARSRTRANLYMSKTAHPFNASLASHGSRRQRSLSVNAIVSRRLKTEASQWSQITLDL